MDEQQILRLAERFLGAVQAGDIDTARACYAPDAKLWRNTDNMEQTVDQNMKVLGWFACKLPDRKYRVLRREALKDGFMQQHVLEATLPNGAPWKLSACLVVKMENGLITRLDEYLDSAETAALNGI
ncbi:MAG TPA: nuclear transport factor 2 family protein [Caulobacteraceae bacterium]|jgi:ketosteroid isomerase-like protein|nr:nuclear transport factor 2 family protein [Caulobacteraceae bacterium]